MKWREVAHEEAKKFVADKGGPRSAEREIGDTPERCSMTYYFEDGSALRVTDTTMKVDAYAPQRYHIGEVEEDVPPSPDDVNSNGCEDRNESASDGKAIAMRSLIAKVHGGIHAMLKMARASR